MSDCSRRHGTSEAQRYDGFDGSSHPDPWTALTAIHVSVQRDFAPARELGLTLVRTDA